jgi:hypothetical protein
LKQVAELLAARSDIAPGDLTEARHHLEAAQHALAGLALGGAQAEPIWAAYDLGQVIRHRLAWDRTPAGGDGVAFSAPLRSARAVPLADIEQLDEVIAGTARAEVFAVERRESEQCA